MAASATFALKAGVWFRRGRLFIVSPDSRGTACPLSGRNSTYRPVQILEAGSDGVAPLDALVGPLLDTCLHEFAHAIFEMLRVPVLGREEDAADQVSAYLILNLGKAKAVTATARKVAVLFYNAVRHGMEYVDPGASSYETRYRTRVVNNLHRRAKAFGFVLQPLEPKAGVAVS